MALQISGYAAIFDAPDLQGDIIYRGAFAQSLKDARSIPMLWQHDLGRPCGKWLDVREDETGLWVHGEVAESVIAEAQALRAGRVSGLSIGFRTRAADQRPGGGRFLRGIDLWEISPVTFPMHPNARLTLSNLTEEAA